MVELIPPLAAVRQVDGVAIRSQKRLSFRRGHLERSSDFGLRDTAGRSRIFEFLTSPFPRPVPPPPCFLP